PDTEVGALPPFGSMSGITTIMDKKLQGMSELIFEGNRHDEAVRMSFAEYERLEKPVTAVFAGLTRSQHVGRGAYLPSSLHVLERGAGGGAKENQQLRSCFCLSPEAVARRRGAPGSMGCSRASYSTCYFN